MIELFCPNCGNPVNTRFCQYCGVELILVNNKPFFKEQYDDIQNLHNTLDSYLSIYSGKKSIANPNDKNLFKDMRDNEFERTQLFNEINSYEINLNDTKKEFISLLKNNQMMYYYSRLDFHFGSTRSKINRLLSSLDYHQKNIDKFRTNYNQFIKNNPNCSEYKNDVKEHVKNLKDMEFRLNNLKQEINNYNKILFKSYDKLKIIDKVLEINEEILTYEHDLNSKLNNKREIQKYNFFKSYNIQSKMNSLISEINEIKIQINYLSSKLDNYNSNYTSFKNNKINDEGKLSVNQANINDLVELKIESDIIKKILLDRTNGKYIESFYELSKYGIPANDMDTLRKKLFIKMPKIEKKIQPIEDTHYHANNIVDINTATAEELSQIPGISHTKANIIVNLRKKEIHIASYEDLEKKLQLQPFQTKEIKKYTTINIKNQHTNDNIEQKTENTQEINKEKENKSKIDINTANEETLTKLPGINIIKAKKIIELRQKGYYIKSYNDLNSKLQLKPHQIAQIKEITIISNKITPKRRRIIDI